MLKQLINIGRNLFGKVKSLMKREHQTCTGTSQELAVVKILFHCMQQYYKDHCVKNEATLGSQTRHIIYIVAG